MTDPSTAAVGRSDPSCSNTTLYWYDLETFGLDPVWDRIAQFAGVRTDLALNVLGPPLVLYCKPSSDYLPDPYSCLVTGITPQFALREGVVEAEFVAAIRAEFLRPKTCVVGYNNLRFDDEILRHTLYRNLYDPYEREWRNGNTRWDIIDMVRLVAALRPERMHWPAGDDGRRSFRLELLTAANGIAHSDAHDALADVMATIELARLIKTRQPRLYDYVFEHRTKQQAATLLNLGAFEPLVHVSGRYSGDRCSLAVVVPLAKHPGNQNGIIVYDLSVDPAPLIELDVEEIRRRVFTAADDREPAQMRVPLKTVHLNRCPVLAPLKVLRPEDESRLALDREALRAHLQRIRNAPDVATKVEAVFEPAVLPKEEDPDAMLYRGGFLGEADRAQLNRLHALSPPALTTAKMNFQDGRLSEMVFRFRARNYPETLTSYECEKWEDFRIRRLAGSGHVGIRTLDAYQSKIEELEGSQTVPRNELLRELREYGEALIGRNS